MTRILLTGSRRFGADALHLCLGLGHDVAAVAAPSADDRLARLAEALGVPARAWGEWPDAAGADLIVAAHSFDIVPRAALEACALGGIGYHPSLLPRHPGRRSVQDTIEAGDTWTGGCVYRLTDVIDGGDVIARAGCPVRPGDDARTLWRRELHPLGLRLLARVLADPAAALSRGEAEAGDEHTPIA